MAYIMWFRKNKLIATSNVVRYAKLENRVKAGPTFIKHFEEKNVLMKVESGRQLLGEFPRWDDEGVVDCYLTPVTPSVTYRNAPEL